MNIKKEMLVIFTLGVAPVVLAYVWGGDSLLLEVLNGTMSSKWFIYYTMLGSVLFAFVAWLYHFKFHRSDKSKSIHALVASVLYESAQAFLSFLRLVAGILFTCVALWAIFGFTYEQLNPMAYALFIGALAAVESLLLSASLQYAEKNWLRIRL